MFSSFWLWPKPLGCFSMFTFHPSGQSSIFPRPELRTFWKDSHTKPPFGVTSDEVVIICPDPFTFHSKQIGFNQTWCTKKTGDLAGRPKQTSEVCHPKEPTCWWEDFRASKPPWCPKFLLVAHRWGARGQCGGESVNLLFKTLITSKETNGNVWKWI